MTIATFPSPSSSSSSSTSQPTTTTTTTRSKELQHRETFHLDSYDSLVKVFQKTRKREGYVDRVVLWVPGGVGGKSIHLGVKEDWVWEVHVSGRSEDKRLMVFLSLIPFFVCSSNLNPALRLRTYGTDIHFHTDLPHLKPLYHLNSPHPHLYAYNTRPNTTYHTPGSLVKDNKTQAPPLPKLVAWVIKLAAFEFRYDSRPLVLGRQGERLGRGEVGLVVPSRESRSN